MNLKQQNRTLHLLQIPDIFICYRQGTGKGHRKTVTSSELSSIINGVATFLMFMFIDPYL
jgi:hypothetical protein